MKDNLRTPAQAADTVVWLAVSKAVVKHPSGLFYQGEQGGASRYLLHRRVMTANKTKEKLFDKKSLKTIFRNNLGEKI